MRNEAAIRLNGVSQSYGGLAVLQNINLEIRRGEFVAVVGPSGCGKTTLLDLISGHLTPTGGTVETTGRIRTIFQRDSLFPWLTARQNILLGLREVKSETERERELTELLTLIRQTDFADYYPRQLSGGMRQRVQLARALAGNSDILLMDEPFSSLDYQTRLRLRRELSLLLISRPRTVVLVTHDIEEAAQLADRIVLLTERPAQIQREIQVALSRPRDLTHPEVIHAMRQMFDLLGLREDAQADRAAQTGS